MFICPVCESARIVQVISSTRRAFCTRCGARWIQEEHRQRAIERPAIVPVGRVGGARSSP